jgi:hypothetical protein
LIENNLTHGRTKKRKKEKSRQKKKGNVGREPLLYHKRESGRLGVPQLVIHPCTADGSPGDRGQSPIPFAKG